MLSELTLKNFQKHESFAIKFDPEITTIVGPSDVGKSSLLRAIRWVCTNEPDGDDFIRRGAQFVEIELVVDGHRIRRYRSKSENTYFLDDREFKAFGRNVPDPIAAILNVGDSNFQDQHDPAFWFSMSAGEVSRSLNAIVDLGIIDESLYAAGKRARGAWDRKCALSDDLKKLRAEHASLAWIPPIQEEWGAIRTLTAKRGQAFAHVARLRAAVQRAGGLKAVAQAADRASQAADTFVGLLEDVQELAVRNSRLAGQIHHLVSCQMAIGMGPPDISNLTEMMDRLKSDGDRCRLLRRRIEMMIDLKRKIDSGPPSGEALLGDVKRFTDAKAMTDRLRDVIRQLKTGVDRKLALAAKADALAGDLAEMTRGQVCPVCESPMKGVA